MAVFALMANEGRKKWKYPPGGEDGFHIMLTSQCFKKTVFQ